MAGDNNKGAAAATGAPRSTLRVAMELVVCTLAIYVCFIGYGLLQEQLYKDRYGPNKEKFDHSLFLVFAQCTLNMVVASFGFLLFRLPPNTVPLREYLQIGVSYIGAMFSSNAALAYVSYPTQALGKSCKLIPVMLTRIFINRARYDAKEYFNVALTTAGITAFQLFQTASEKKGHDTADSAFGLLLLFLSLVLDGYTGPKQEHMISVHKPSITHMMFWMNFWSSLLVGCALVVTGRLMPGLAFCAAYPDVVLKMVVFSVLSAFGQIVILITVFRFDSLVLTTITTTRKFFTLLASVVWFGHALSAAQWAGVAMVFLGLGLNTYTKYHKNKAQHRAHAATANGHAHAS